MKVRARSRRLVGTRCGGDVPEPIYTVDVGALRVSIPERISGPEAFVYAAKLAMHVRAALFALGASILSACASQPHVIRTPDVCPAKPETPAVAKVDLPEFLPVLNASEIASGDPHRISSEILRVRVESAAQYQACLTNDRQQRAWIIQHSEEE